MHQTSRSANRFLQSLSPADFELLAPHLRSVELTNAAVLFETGGEIDRVYFPLNGAVSLVVPLGGGDMVEAGMIGRDGIVGTPAALDSATAINQAVVQVGGQASVAGVAPIQSAARQSATLRTALYQYDQLLLVQAQQSAACNATHTVEERLCRWLLRSRDVLESDLLPLTQEFVAQMLGVRRTSVTLVASRLKEAKLIKYRRGRVEVLDLEGLQDSACECYRAFKQQEARLLGRTMA
ncbi:MAG TPA: Crp/Fnr family transcriptional regulator [Xanthobacteraceae bacterium]|nr:Crp/Fnr family transcriptional regulator [Xanthobacteraceae bacterium]